jgi:hypothetical protein
MQQSIPMMQPLAPAGRISKSRRRRAWGQFGASVLMGFLILVPVILYTPSVASPTLDHSSPIKLCKESSANSPPSFFEPDILMGNFTLGQARMIDIGWNIIVGRGMQAAMVHGSYGIVMQGLTRIAEASPVSYSLFSSLVFQTTEVSSLKPVAQGVLQLRGWRPKFAMAWFTYSIVLMAAIPTLFDASSGYARSTGLTFFPSDNLNGTYYRPFDHLPSNVMQSISQRGTQAYACSPDISYQWGFVSRWIWIVFPLYSVWVFGMYVMWMDAQHNSKLTRLGRKLGKWKGIVDLANAVDGELAPLTATYSDAELTKLLRNRRPVLYFTDQDGNDIQQIHLMPEK